MYVDLFGGSGILSHFAKATYPEATVIYNDYDGYYERCRNIDKTNALLSKIKQEFAHIPPGKRFSHEDMAVLCDLIDAAEFKDWGTLSSNLLFSGNYVNNLQSFSKQPVYNNWRAREYKSKKDYFDGLTIVCKDYRDLAIDGFLIVDPPYLSTNINTYGIHWRLKDYIDVIKTLEGKEFCYFTSAKSQLAELFDAIDGAFGFQNPFKRARKVTRKSRYNCVSETHEHMYIKTN